MSARIHFVLASAGDVAADRAFERSAASALSTVTVVDAHEHGLAAAVNDVVAASAADFISVVTSAGTIRSGAIEVLLAELDAHEGADLFYTNEGIRKGRAITSVAKPVYSPERLRSQNYVGDLVIVRAEAFTRLGGLDPALPGAEVYDLVLRIARSGRVVEHITETAYLAGRGSGWTASAEDVRSSTRTALEAHLAATGGGEVRAIGLDGVHDTRRVVIGSPLVSIVIPSRGTHVEVDGEQLCFVTQAVRSIVEKSTYANYELVIVLDAVAEPAVIAELHLLAGERLRIVDWNRPFNFSEKINHGALHSRGEYVLLLNDDVKVITPDWIESLLALAQLPGAGMSGALLYFGDDSIQHAGHAYYDDDVSHIGLDADHDDPGPLNGYRVEREVSGVTAACALMPMSVFLEVGGLTNLLPGNFNDVDLCMKVTWLGYEIYWTPHAQLTHYESKTRDPAVHGFEIEVAWSRWGARMHDPRYWPYPHSRTPV